MENQFNNSEKAPVDRQEVVNRLKDYSIEDETTRNLLSSWVDQIEASAQAFTDKKEVYMARIENGMDIANLYIETGYLYEALDSLDGIAEIANQYKEYDLLAQIDSLIAETRAMIDSYYEKRAEKVKSLGYTIAVDNEKHLELEKDGYIITLQHFQKPSKEGIVNGGRIFDMMIGKSGEAGYTALFDPISENPELSAEPTDEAIKKIYQEVIDNLN